MPSDSCRRYVDEKEAKPGGILIPELFSPKFTTFGKGGASFAGCQEISLLELLPLAVHFP